MDCTIEKIKRDDLPALAEFHATIYGKESPDYKDLSMLRWLLRDPYDDRLCNGFLARNEEGKLLGMIGYAINEYRIGDRVVKGVIPMSWMVASSERGILGIRLILKVLKLGDFSFALGGTQLAINSYGAGKLNPIGKADIYTKVLCVYRYVTYRGYLSSIDFIKSLLFFRRKRMCPVNPEFELQPYDENHHDPEQFYEELAMIPTKERNRWIMGCPKVESHAFSIIYQGRKMGNCICYVSRGHRSVKRARIVLMPYAGRDLGFYRQALAHLENFLVGQGCCSISLFTMHPTLQNALKSCGFRHYSRLQGYQVFMRSNHDVVEPSTCSDWFLSYYESDKGHLYF